jgi:hypothetical protein
MLGGEHIVVEPVGLECAALGKGENRVRGGAESEDRWFAGPDLLCHSPGDDLGRTIGQPRQLVDGVRDVPEVAGVVSHVGADHLVGSHDDAVDQVSGDLYSVSRT